MPGPRRSRVSTARISPLEQVRVQGKTFQSHQRATAAQTVTGEESVPPFMALANSQQFWHWPHCPGGLLHHTRQPWPQFTCAKGALAVCRPLSRET